ncbi:MAG: Hpt domain-containing protein [Novosphingobium sp.]
MPDNQSRLDAIRKRFLGRLSEQRDMLERMSGLERSDDEILDIVHKIAGIAGSLGYPALSAAASEVELLLVDTSPAALQETAQFKRLMQQVDAALEQT